ncbi:MAG: prepilin-type N-terminal cleavage/methylation domain-containing protein [bacterium]
MSNRAAFTLIELLIVVAIIGILAAIAVPNFMNALVRARVARSYGDMRSLATAVQMNLADRGVLLVDMTDGHTLWGMTRTAKVFKNAGIGPFGLRTYEDVLSPLTTPISYISSIPLDPFHVWRSNSQEYDASVMYDGFEFIHSKTYVYSDNDPEDPGPDHDFLFTAGRPLPTGEFLFRGGGPVQRGAGGNSTTAIEVFYIQYAASNGLMSEGDIYLRGGGGTNINSLRGGS